MTLRNEATMRINDLIQRTGMKIAEGDRTAVDEFDELTEVVDGLRSVVQTLVELWDAAGRDGDGEKFIDEALFVVLVDAGRNALGVTVNDG
jgi:hypothetical protein